MKLLSIFLLGVTLIFGGVTASVADTSGKFKGASNHITTGDVSVTKNADGTHTVTLGANFSLDGAPDPYVAFGKNGTFSPSGNLGVLKSKTGAQSYIVPASIDPAKFNEIYIWCLKFSVPLGVAQLN
jgi:hypothetical protein